MSALPTPTIPALQTLRRRVTRMRSAPQMSTMNNKEQFDLILKRN